MPHRQHHQEGPSEHHQHQHHHHKGEDDADQHHHHHHDKEEQCEGHEHKKHHDDKKHHHGGGHEQSGHKKRNSHGHGHGAEAAEGEASSSHHHHHDKGHQGDQKEHKSKGGAHQGQRRKTIHDEEYKNLSHRELLRKLAYEIMEAKEIYTEFSEESVAELEGIKKEYELHQTEADWKAAGYKDQRSLVWVSIDNDDSRDLDQLSTAFYDDKKRLHVLVSIADVDHLVHYQTAIDRHAEHNSTSVYTPAKVFTMLPELLSFDLTSLNQGVDRRSVVIDMTFESPDSGVIIEEDVYLSVAHNHAKLAYPSVGAWIEQKSEDGGDVPPPAPIADRKDLQENILIQDRVAQALLARRLESGALEFDKREGLIKWDGDSIKEVTLEKRNRATMLIENLMIAANGASSRFLEKHGLSTLQRVVRDPECWELLQTLAKKLGGHLPDQPQSKALQLFLNARRKADPDTFPDLSLEVIKLMGRGEYCYQSIGEEHEGHFGLAVLDYTHTTAPNRRFPDLITQRLIKSILMKTESPYNEARMQDLAKHVTYLEGETTKIERQLRKSACAILLQDKIGKEYDGIITGASSKGTYVRIFDPPVEGRVVKRASGCSVGNKVKVILHEVDIIKGHIDFERLKEKKLRHQQEPAVDDE